MEIKELTLYCRNIGKQKAFYTGLLGIPLADNSAHSFCIRAGGSRLVFIERKDATPYHFAFNIPPDRDVEALHWLRNKVNILPNEDRELIRFDSWNATSMYFYDEEKNIVEFIARRDLPPSGNSRPFDGTMLTSISEIGVACDNIREVYEKLVNTTCLQKYSGDTDRFCAIGDAYGLFIVIDRNRKKWFPCNDVAFPSDFKLNFFFKEQDWKMNFKKGRIALRPS